MEFEQRGVHPTNDNLLHTFSIHLTGHFFDLESMHLFDDVLLAPLAQWAARSR